MNTRFRESFGADLSAITEAGLLRRIKGVIEQVESARTFQQIPNLKRLDAKGKYYRIRVGDYRVGFVFEQGSVVCALPQPQGDLPVLSLNGRRPP